MAKKSKFEFVVKLFVLLKKLLRKECHDIDITVDTMTGE